MKKCDKMWTEFDTYLKRLVIRASYNVQFLITSEFLTVSL